MKKIIFLFAAFGLSCFTLQAQVNIDAGPVGYDIILVAGQDNTHYGSSLNNQLDTVSSRVYTLNRSSSRDYKISQAGPVLDFWTRQSNRNSFAITFSNLYVHNILADSKRKVLIIPCGYSGSSINNWSKGRSIYNDAMDRVNYVLENIPGSKIVAILWHHGEANIGMSQYQTVFHQMIADMRADIKQVNTIDIPFILGGMVPYWVGTSTSRNAMQNILRETPNRVPNAMYADPEWPFVITKPNNSLDAIHYDSNGQREMGARYFDAFTQVK